MEQKIHITLGKLNWPNSVSEEKLKEEFTLDEINDYIKYER